MRSDRSLRRQSGTIAQAKTSWRSSELPVNHTVDTLYDHDMHLASSSTKKVWFHGLSHFPGSKLAASSSVPYLNAQLRGRLPQWIKAQHDRYGSDVVRIHPNGLSFIGDTAWKDMFVNRYGSRKFKKDSIIYGKAPGGVDSILTANNNDHTRMRSLIAHAFTEKALKSQESLIMSYVKLLVDELETEVKRAPDGRVDMVQWLTWVTFDIVGDLSMGKTFHSLSDRTNHPWVSFLSETFKAIVFMSSLRQLRVPERLVPFFLPKGLYFKRMSHLRSVSECVDQRMAENPDRPDFISYILAQNNEKGMTTSELKANASLFVGAGSFSTATVLCGAIYYLCKSPSALRAATTEVRSAFKTREAITFDSVTHLKYIAAVINESHRMYPAALAGSPHVTPDDGADISGHWVPRGTRVMINQWAAYQSALNFASPNEFVPERWLGDPRFVDDRKDVFQPFSVGPRNCIGK
ncbi:MAG: hypothetical protein Q9166_007883, partial [cf. Caloplaca sp. 2 TL-2023]